MLVAANAVATAAVAAAPFTFEGSEQIAFPFAAIPTATCGRVQVVGVVASAVAAATIPVTFEGSEQIAFPFAEIPVATCGSVQVVGAGESDKAVAAPPEPLQVPPV